MLTNGKNCGFHIMYHLPQWKKWKVALNFSEQKTARQLTHDMTSSFDLTTLSHLLLIVTWWIFPERTSLCLDMSSVTDTSAVRGIPTPTLLASGVSQSSCLQHPALNSQMCVTPSCVHMPKFSMSQGGDRKVFWLSVPVCWSQWLSKVFLQKHGVFIKPSWTF